MASKRFVRKTGRNPNFAKEAARTLQPIYYGSNTTSIMDSWIFNDSSEITNKEKETEPKRHNKKEIEARLKELIHKQKITGLK